MKKFTSAELDKALKELPIDGSLSDFENENISEGEMAFSIYNHLQAMGLLEMKTVTNSRDVMIAARLTNKGIVFRNNGGFTQEAKDKWNKIYRDFLIVVLGGLAASIFLYFIQKMFK